MTRPQALRVIALASQVEMALVRRDAVAGALLAQAARAAADGSAGEYLRAAAEISRATDLAADEPARKVAQALNRVALQEAQAAALR